MRRLGGKGETHVRVMPALDANGKELPQLEVPRTDEYHPLELIGDSFAQYDTVKFYGDKKYNMLTEVTDPIQGLADPVTTCNRALYNYCKTNRKQAPDNWYNWFFPTEGYPLVMKPKPMLYIKGVLITLNGEPMMKGNEPTPLYPVVLQVSQKSAEIELFNGMLSPADPSKELSVENSVLGDVTSSLNGRTLVFQPTKRVNEQTKKMQTYVLVAPGEVYPLDLALVRKLHEPWENLMLLPTTEFLLERLCETLGYEAVYFALENTPYGPKLPAKAQGAAAPAVHASAAKPAAPEPEATPPWKKAMVDSEISYLPKPKAAAVQAPIQAHTVTKNYSMELDREGLKRRLALEQAKLNTIMKPEEDISETNEE